MPIAIVTPEDRLEKYQDSLWNYRPMPRKYDHPLLRKGALEDLRYSDLKEAKAKLMESYDAIRDYYKENPEGTLPNPVFGNLNRL